LQLIFIGNIQPKDFLGIMTFFTMQVETMQNTTLHRNIFQRLLGICVTKKPLDEGCWTFDDGKIVVDLASAPELSSVNGAIRLEAKTLNERVLIIHGDDGQYYAFQNRCTHAKRRLDPMPGMQQVQCCSIGRSIYDYNGKIISGSAKDDIQAYPVIVDNGKLVITL
jgi:nitrite reductase/ring-hydroxylating ferredoxin subunit